MASQDPMLAPPDMLTTCVNISEWSKLCKVDEKSLASYKKKCDQVNTGKITMTNMPKRNRRDWTAWAFSWQTKSPLIHLKKLSTKPVQIIISVTGSQHGR
jgi:hypothetical protein